MCAHDVGVQAARAAYAFTVSAHDARPGTRKPRNPDAGSDSRRDRTRRSAWRGVESKRSAASFVYVICGFITSPVSYAPRRLSLVFAHEDRTGSDRLNHDRHTTHAARAPRAALTIPPLLSTIQRMRTRAGPRPWSRATVALGPC